MNMKLVLQMLIIVSCVYATIAVAAHHHTHLDATDDCYICYLEQQNLLNVEQSPIQGLISAHHIFIPTNKLLISTTYIRINNKSPPSLLA